MPKSKQIETKRQYKKVDLSDRYQEIGINAVAAALRCQKEKKQTDAMSASRQQKEDSSKRSANGPVKS